MEGFLYFIPIFCPQTQESVKIPVINTVDKDQLPYFEYAAFALPIFDSREDKGRGYESGPP